MEANTTPGAGQPAQRDAGAAHRMETPLFRAIRATAEIESAEDRIVLLSFSSETPYTRQSFFDEPWVEVLGHQDSEVDLSRLKARAPVLYNHRRTREDRIGSVLDAWIRDGRGYARVQFSRRDDIADIWTDLGDGHLPNVSVGYLIHDRELTRQNADGPNEYRVTRWEPLEVSIVDIPADPSVGVGRAFSITDAGELPASTGDKTMTDEARKQAVEEGRRLEVERQQAIRDQFELVDAENDPALRQLREQLTADPKATGEIAGRKILEHIGRHKSPSGPTAVMPDSKGSPHVAPGTDRGFSREASDAMLFRVGIKPADKISVHARDLSHSSLLDLARTCLSQVGHSGSGMGPAQIVSRAMTTSDFPNLLSNVGEQMVIAGFQGSEEATHRLWTKESSHRDFKPAGRAAVSETPGLDIVSEDAEFTHGKLEETGDTATLATYGKILSISRQAIINDQLEQLATIALAFGQSALRLELDTCYAILTTNPTMSDGTVLFHADHANLGTAGAPSVTTLGEARKLMRNQRGVNDESYLGLVPAVLIVPTTLETVAEQLLASIYDPSTSNSAETQNPFARKLALAADPRLDTNSTSAWYLAASPAQFGGVERIYLQGNMQPYVEERAGWERDVLEVKIRHDFAAKAFAHHGLVKNAG